MKDTLVKIFTLIFQITLPLFLLLGAAVVLVQLVAVIIGNGALAVGVNSVLKIWAIRTSCITAFCGFFLSYLKPKKAKSE